MRQLREPGGCPWDRRQTHRSLRPFAIEEAFELARAIELGDERGMEDELGDVLLQVLLHSRIGQEEGRFDLRSVAAGLARKLVRRHPHVFAGAGAADAEAVRRSWRDAKAAERRDAGRKTRDAGDASELLPRPDPALPALFASQRMQRAAAATGFDWRQAADAVHKVAEEVAELVAAQAEGSRDALRDELGDLLFMLVNIARLLDLDAETALRHANEKFYRRFSAMEALARRRGLSLTGMDLEEMDRLWDQVKDGE